MILYVRFNLWVCMFVCEFVCLLIARDRNRYLREIRIVTKFRLGNMKARDQLGRLGINGRLILEWISDKLFVRIWTVRTSFFQQAFMKKFVNRRVAYIQ
jgi:hypothetical protein